MIQLLFFFGFIFLVGVCEGDAYIRVMILHDFPWVMHFQSFFQKKGEFEIFYPSIFYHTELVNPYMPM